MPSKTSTSYIPTDHQLYFFLTSPKHHKTYFVHFFFAPNIVSKSTTILYRGQKPTNEIV